MHNSKVFKVTALISATLTLCVYCSLLLPVIVGVRLPSATEDLVLSKQEKLALDKFKPRVLPILPHSYMKNELYLIRWLRARNLNIAAAEEMLKSNLRWRKQEKIDTIFSEDWSDMSTDYPYINTTFDKAGRPLGMVSLGPQWDIRKMAVSGRLPRLLRYMNTLLENGSERIRKEQRKGNAVTRWSVIFNLEGFNEIQHACPLCLPAYVNLISTFESRYPQEAHQVVFINTPPAFQIVVNLVDPLLSPYTQSVVQYLGNDKREWMSYLDKYISRDQRTVEYGGNL